MKEREIFIENNTANKWKGNQHIYVQGTYKNSTQPINFYLGLKVGTPAADTESSVHDRISDDREETQTSL